MILGFKEFLDTKKKKPTYFREKILTCAAMEKLRIENPARVSYPLEGVPVQQLPSGLKVPFRAKLHTIREDSHDRWKPGMSIQMVYRGAGYKIIDEFNKGIPELSKCVSIQELKLWRVAGRSRNDIDYTKFETKIMCTIDGHRFDDFEKLALNDGFESVEDFFAWFKKDFTGKIIHFTNLRY